MPFQSLSIDLLMCPILDCLIFPQAWHQLQYQIHDNSPEILYKIEYEIDKTIDFIQNIPTLYWIFYFKRKSQMGKTESVLFNISIQCIIKYLVQSHDYTWFVIKMLSLIQFLFFTNFKKTSDIIWHDLNLIKSLKKWNKK